jgi:hypothetical protein
MRQSLLAVILFFLGTAAYAGGVRGYIRDNTGQALEFASIFVQETGSGTITNVEGFYELRLDPGNYTLVFQYLGYESHVEKVAVGDLFKELNITLNQQPLELKTVDVIEGNEDPAYTVMRKAIAKASYHRQQLDGYKAQVYIKGSGRLLKAPFFLRKELKKEGIDSTKAFTSESVSLIEYERPNTFREKVISVYTQGEDNNSSPTSFINGSFYEPEIAEAISPLSTKAFAYYKFKLDGFFMDRGYGVNRIQVIPRSRGENVFEGTIFIVEDLWSIHSLSLKTYKFGIGFLVNQVYAPIAEQVWLPVSHRFDVDGKILGFAFEYKYLATVSDYEITLNPDLDYDFAVVDEKLEKELAQQIQEQAKDNPKAATAQEKLASGEELTRKDLRRLLREYEKEEAKEQEEPEVVMHQEYKVDSMAYKRDSTYWATIRPVPLTKYEVRGYATEDSLSRADTLEQNTNTIGGRGRKSKAFNLGDIFFGDTYRIGEKSRLTYESPLLHLNFNPTEGYNVSTNFIYNNRTDNPFKFTLTPRYAFAREKLTGKAAMDFTFGEKGKRTNLTLEGGRYIQQYNQENPISQLLNTFANLLSERNYLSILEKDYGRISYNKQARENLKFNGYVEYARRYPLENVTTQTWFNRDDRSYASNIPYNEEYEYPIPDPEVAVVFNVGVETRPWQKYRVYNGKRRPIENSSPLLSLYYRKGISGVLESEVDYDLVDFYIRHKFRAGARGLIDFKINAGAFLNNKAVGFADFKHFKGNQLALTTSDPVGSYRLLEYYRHSTADKYLGAHVHYQFRKFLFTQLPEVWMLGIKENVFVNYLATPTSKNYFEVGYSIDNILRVFRIELAASFQNGQYRDFGILFGIASNLGFINIE